MRRSALQEKFPIFAFVFVLLLSAVALASEPIRIETFKTHSRISIAIGGNVPAEWKNQNDSFEIILKGLSLFDLGAELGEETAFSERLAKLQDPRAKIVTVRENTDGIVIKGKWIYPTGPSAPAEPRMESFDYRDESPSRYIVDFWLKKGPTVAEVQAARKQAELLDRLKKKKAEAEQRVQRKIASEKRRSESDDVLRFCRQPLSEKNDVILPFFAFHEPVKFSRWVSSTTPDSRFSYYEPAGDTKDARYVRLALKLYRQGKPGLTVRTLDFLETEHPDSEYRHEMRFLRANALIRLGLKEQAESILKELIRDVKGKPVALHSAMYLAAKTADELPGWASLELFLSLISEYPEHRLAWLFHLGAAESYAAMKQTEKAAKEYQWVMENAPERASKAEAASRLGNIYLNRQQYDQALAGYFQGLHYFKEEMDKHPSIHLNRSEALYRLGQFDRSKASFEEFLKKFPSHPAGWRASYRLAEIEEQKSAGAGRERYYETINRYPFSAGATLARMRLAACGDHGGMNEQSVARLFSDEAEKFDGKGDVQMDRYVEFKGLTQVRAFVGFGRYDQAVAKVVQQIYSKKDSPVREILNSTVAVVFRRQLNELLSHGKKLEALAFYREKISKLPREHRKEDPEYLLALSQSASDLGFGSLAKELSAEYAEVAALSKNSGNRTLAAEDANQWMKVSEERFTEAKALWIQSRARTLGENEEKIRSLLAEVREESARSYEREIILGLLDEKKAQFNTALTHALKAQMLKPAAPATNLRLESWVAGLQVKAGDPQIALQMLSNLEGRMATQNSKSEKGAGDQSIEEILGLPAPMSIEQSIFTRAEISEKLGRWGDVAAAYSRAVDEGLGGGQALYGFGRALLKAGNRQKGLEVLQKLVESKAAESKNDLWKRLASETLANETL